LEEKKAEEQKENISTLNSNFCVDITADSVNFYLESEQKEVFKSFIYISSLENRLKCNSYFLLSFLIKWFLHLILLVLIILKI